MKSKITHKQIEYVPVFAAEHGKLFHTPSDATCWLLNNGYTDAEVQGLTIAIKYNVKFYDSYWRIASKEDLESHVFTVVKSHKKIAEPKWICLETGDRFISAKDCLRWLTVNGCKNVNHNHQQHLGIRPLAGLNFERIQPNKEYIPTNPNAKPLEKILPLFKAKSLEQNPPLKKVKSLDKWICLETGDRFISAKDCLRWLSENGCKNVNHNHQQHLGIRSLAGLNFERIQTDKEYIPTNPNAKPLEDVFPKKPSIKYQLEGTSNNFRSKTDAMDWFKANLKRIEA